MPFVLVAIHTSTMASLFTADEEDMIFRALSCPPEELRSVLPINMSLTLSDVVLDLMTKKLNYQRHNHPNSSHFNNSSRQMEQVLNSIIFTAVCVFGILGNVLNLVVLSHRSWQVNLGRMEMFVQSGLIALATSDLCYCISALPMGFVDQHRESYGEVYDSLNFSLLYLTFCNGIINTFVLCSTILTVALAVGRYFAIVHPIRAREVIGMTFAKRILISVFIVCTLINVPRFWFHQIRSVTCISNKNRFYYRRLEGPIYSYKTDYLIVYFVLAICVPLALLAFCNTYLVRALRNPVAPPIVRRKSGMRSEGSYRITLSLVIIVIAFFVLVVPAETLNFWKKIIYQSKANPDKYNLPIAILSCLQAINFAFNFILYCAVNIHFKRTMRSLFQGKWSYLRRRHGSTRNESFTFTSAANGYRTSHGQHMTLEVCTSSIKKTSLCEL